MAVALAESLERLYPVPAGPGSFAVSDLRDYLCGDWMIARLIQDRHGGESGSLIGWARFDPRGGGLEYSERGEMRLGGYRGLVSRGYRYAFPGLRCATVFFLDGRPFHDLDLSAGEADVQHLCGQDRYSGSFTVRNADAWDCLWTVTGPRKDYTIASRFLRPACSA